jgi:type III secretion protein U
MSGARTEEPTPRRLRDARRRGHVARSRELAGAAALSAGLAALPIAGPWAASELAGLVRSALLSASAGSSPPFRAFEEATFHLARIGAPFVVAPAIAAGAVAALQSGFTVSLEPLRFRLDRLDPSRWLGRIASADCLLRVGLGLAKATLVLALLWGWLSDSSRAFAQLPGFGAAAIGRAVPLGRLARRLAVAALTFGALDLALARRRHRRELIMTRDERRRESKEDEGDPQHRAERNRLHRALLEGGPVSKATVVVVNPTRIAVALQHRRGSDAAPRVLAKGAGAAAARIRSAARRAGVPIVRDVALARALLRLAEAGDEIPEQLYDAAASVLVHVYGLRREGA